MRKLLILLFIPLFLIYGCGPNTTIDHVLKKRPVQTNYLFDYAHLFDNCSNSTNQYLKSIHDNHQIDAVIVVLPSVPKKQTPDETANKIFNNWNIGRNCNGRGILLLFFAKEKKVKMEVSYEIEEVFTDGFCGYITDLQLKHYFMSGNIDIGLIAVMEEIESRAALKIGNNTTVETITILDKRLVSGGAGIERDLTKYQNNIEKDINGDYSAAKSPREAWEKFKRSWREKIHNPYLGIYTEISKLAFRDYQQSTDSMFTKQIDRYEDIPYNICQEGNYAVIYFGVGEKGRPPFFFCKTASGWQFDMYHQRMFIRQSSNNYWLFEYSDHPYMSIVRTLKSDYYRTVDIPFSKDDRYSLDKDPVLAEQILTLEKGYEQNPHDFLTLLSLGRLYTITSMGPKGITFLKEAARINPKNPLPHKYLAISYHEYFYELKESTKEMELYCRMEPKDVFGTNYLGYLYFLEKRHSKAIQTLKKSLNLDPSNLFAYCKLAEVFGDLSKYRYLQNGFGLLTGFYKIQSIQMVNKAQKLANKNYWRINWLKDFYNLNEHI